VLASDGQVASPQSAGPARVLFSRNSLLGPAELYTVSRDGKDVRKLTAQNDEKVKAARFGKPEPFSFTGAGGDTVHGWIVQPVDFDPAKKYPIAFLIHGGAGRAPSVTTSTTAGTRRPTPAPATQR